MGAASCYRFIQEGVIQLNDVEVVAKTIIYALQGMIMLSFSSNGITKQEDIKEQLVKPVNYLLKINKGSLVIGMVLLFLIPWMVFIALLMINFKKFAADGI